MPSHNNNIITLLFLFLSLSITFTSSLNSDGLSLLALKAAIDVDPTGILTSWSDSDSLPTPCSWEGISCTNKQVTQITLVSKSLTGYIPSELGHLTELTTLQLSNNNFTKTIPSSLFTNKLIFLDLSHNSLSGPLPSSLTSLTSLVHFDLSSNFLNGSLPESLSELISLTGTLNLSHNSFSGQIPEKLGNLPVEVSLDLRDNMLSGEIPQVGSLLNQGPTAFSGNPGLCGFPLRNLCQDETKVPDYLPENPDTNPNAVRTEPVQDGRGRGGLFVVVGLVLVSVGVVVVLMLVVVRRRRRRLNDREGGFEKGKVEGEVLGCGEEQKGRFVVVDEGFGLELEDLLRASAYVVGKSRSGIVYKVVGGGKGSVPAATVAVRRLSEGDDGGLRFKEFEAEVEAIGRLRHPNVVPLRAYYYASDEKLLITDFIRNGSLHTALHGRPSDSSPPLSWAARIKIAQGTARGLMYIHEFSGRKYVHGNIKSTKILLDDDLHPYISGFGLTRLCLGTLKSTTFTHKRQNSNQSIVVSTKSSKVAANSKNYMAPEVRMYGGKFTQKCDVYSFGIVLLELLTGRLPDLGPDLGPESDQKELESFVRKAFREEQPLSEIIDPALLPEVNAKKQVVAAFHVALNCTEHDPELRPRMRTISESLDHIKIQ